MTKEKFKKAIDVIGLPRLIVFCFFIAIIITAYVNGINVPSFFSSTIKYWGMWCVLVLAMIPTIKCGIGPNFGISLGIVCGILGTLLAIEFEITALVDGMVPGLGPWVAMLFAMVISAAVAWLVGIGYGKLLNLVKGSEMTVTTYIGYSVIYLMCIVWFRAPFSSGEIIWNLGGKGVRNSVSMESSFGNLLNDAFGFYIGGESGIYIPTGLILFCLLMCLVVHLYFKSKTGLAIAASGSNPTFARASGINVDKMRVKGIAMSTMLGAVGIVVYNQGFGFLQAYGAPLQMGFLCVASVLIGGATTTKATILHVIIGTFLYQGLIIFTPPVSNELLAGTDISDTMRQIIQNGVILYALAKAKGGSSHE
ncbi:MAG: ABC transporter permease [Lachnospiraceae bacterium]|nr:ABC transporter permease [Lachnospiraceae bacterium]